MFPLNCSTSRESSFVFPQFNSLSHPHFFLLVHTAWKMQEYHAVYSIQFLWQALYPAFEAFILQHLKRTYLYTFCRCICYILKDFQKRSWNISSASLGKFIWIFSVLRKANYMELPLNPRMAMYQALVSFPFFIFFSQILTLIKRFLSSEVREVGPNDLNAQQHNNWTFS